MPLTHDGLRAYPYHQAVQHIGSTAVLCHEGLRFEDRQGLGDQGKPPESLEIQKSHLGGAVLEEMVLLGHALPAGAGEEGRQGQRSISTGS